MTRVDENRENQRLQEQKRLEEKQRAQSQEGREQFSKLVAAKQETTSKEQRKGSEAKGEQAQAQAQARGRSLAQNMLLAKQGIQANTFQSNLAKHGQKNLQEAKAQTTHRSDEMQENRRTESEQRSVEHKKSDKQVDAHNDKLAAISRDDHKKRREDGSAEDGSSGQQSGFGRADLPQNQGAQAASSTQQSGAAGAATIPPHIMQAIVKKLMAGMTPEGVSTVIIEFNDNVLSGSNLSLSAKDGKVTARFQSGDNNVRRLLSASKGELQRAFSERGLSLERFEVVGY